MRYFKTTFKVTAPDSTAAIASELLSDALGECGYESFVDTDEGVLEGYIQQDMYNEAAVRVAADGLPIDGVTVEFETEAIEDQDWNETWETEEGFEPIDVEGRIVIYDALHTDPSTLVVPDGTKDSEYNIEIGIRARNAFGTGTHETTQMMVATILSLPLEGKRVLDCGCGTGILGIAAMKCGAQEVVAYDIDEWSVENTRYNAMLNGVADGIAALEGDSAVLSHVSGVFDVVVANINRNILLADMPTFRELMTADGVLALSGFYAEDVPMLLDKAADLGLKLVSQKEKNGWQCLVFGL